MDLATFREPGEFFPQIDKPKVTVDRRQVDLSAEGLGTCTLDVVRTFSAMMLELPNSDTIAARYSSDLGTPVSELVVRISHYLAKYWIGPNLPTGKPPTRLDFVKLSIENPEAFAKLSAALGREDDDGAGK